MDSFVHTACGQEADAAHAVARIWPFEDSEIIRVYGVDCSACGEFEMQDPSWLRKGIWWLLGDFFWNGEVHAIKPQ